MHRILLIDDDERLAPPLATYLRRFDFELVSALRPSTGLARLAQGDISAVILDVMLPEQDGFALCRQIRSQSQVPILMLTARGELSDKVVGLELGADDYLPKPFEPRELAARLQTILRRMSVAPGATAAPTAPSVFFASAQGVPAPAAPAGLLQFDGLQVDTLRREVLRQGQAVALTGTEFELLCLLARQPQRMFSRDEILNQLRGQDAELFTRAVDILVSRIRRKLAPLDAIKTLRNAGYALALAPAAGPSPAPESTASPAPAPAPAR